MTRNIPSTHNLDALTNDERIVVAAGREAWASITKTFETWVVLGEAIIMLRNKANTTGGRKTFQRLLDQNGLGKVDGGEISRLEKIMANLDAVRVWHKTLPMNRQIAWSSPSSVIRQATGPDGSRLFPSKKGGKPVPKARPSVAAGVSELEAAQGRIKELNEELAAANQATTPEAPTGKSKPLAIDGTDFKSWPLADRRKFVDAAGLDLLIKSAAPADQDKLRKGGKTAEVQKPGGDFEALRSAYAAGYVNKINTAKGKAAQKRAIKEETVALQEAIRAALHGPAAPLADAERQLNAAMGAE
jgi:hypothetical protein